MLFQNLCEAYCATRPSRNVEGDDLRSFQSFIDKRDDLRIMQLFNGRQKYEELPKLDDPTPRFQESFKWFQKHILPPLRKSLEFLIPEAQGNQKFNSFLKNEYDLFLIALFFGVIYQVNPEFVEGIFKEKTTELAQVITPLFNHCSTHFSEIIETFTEAFVAFDEKENNKMMNNLLLLFLTKIIVNPVTTIDLKYIKMLEIPAYPGPDRLYAKCFVVRIKDVDTGQYSLKCYRKQDHGSYYSIENEWWEEVCTIPMNLKEFTKQDFLDRIRCNFTGIKLFTENNKQYEHLRELIIDKKSIDAIGRPFTVE